MGDIWADLHFFSEPSPSTPGLVIAAVVRNTLTFASVVCLFFNRKWAAYLILLAALLGLWRRLAYLIPVFTLTPGSEFLLIHSGTDLAFRILLLGIAIGWFTGRKV